MSGSSSQRPPPAIIAAEAHMPTDDSQHAFSPAASDVGSLASHAHTASHRYAAGSLGTAGMSSLNLAFPGASSGAAQGMAGFNAISAVLNNPHRASRPIDPSSSRYPAVSASHTELPKVKRADFDAYLASVRPEWERLERNRRMGQSGRARLDAEDKANALAAAAAEEGDAAAKGRVSIEEARSMATGKRRLPPLSAVPQIFFSEEFDMGNPYTFDLVTERYKSIEGVDGLSAAAANEGGVYDVALNQMLQEKLSYYSDVVEQHLILEISARSSSFFAALGNLQDLEAEAASCLTRVEALQHELHRRDEREAKAGLRIIRAQAQRRELSERQAAVQAVRELVERRDLARLLVQSGQWDEALDVIASLRDMLDGTTSAAASSALPAHLDLEFSAIPAIAAMQPQLRELSDTIAVQLEGELLGVLAADLSERIGSPAEHHAHADATAIQVRAETRAEAIHGRAARPNGAAMTNAPTAHLTPADTQLAERIAPLLAGLVRTGGAEAFVDAYRKTALRGVRQATRAFLAFDAASPDEAELEHLAALIEDDELASGKSDAKAVPGGAAAASRLREVSHERFLALLGGLLDGFTRASRAIEAHTRVVVKVLGDVASAEGATREADTQSMPHGVTPALPLTLASILQDATSLAHVLGSRLLSLRAAAHVKLALPEFLDLFALAWGYVLRSEVLARRMIVGLRGAILNQAKSWLAAFHRARIEDAAKKVEEEMWGQAEVTPADQEEVRLIVESATGDPAALVLLTDDGRAAAKASKENDGAAVEEAATSKTLEIEDRQYYVVGASLHVLRLLGEYLRVVINLPLLTTEAMGRVVEFLKQFNSRTCQVVLGAGAMRSAGLKNITAKHLALASQSLSIVITLIPYVRETVRRHLSATQAVMLVEFDKLRRDYQEHQYEIHAKLVAIMSDRLTVHCRALSNLDFNAPLPGSPPEPSKPIADLVKETATLHKVLYKYLHESSVENVMGQVLTSIDKRLAVEIGQTEVRGSEARERLTEDKALLDKKLGTLKSVEWKPSELESVLAEKQKSSAPPASPVPSEPATPAPYKARLPFLARRAGSSATHSPGGTNGRTSFDSAPGTPPLASRPSFDARRSMDRPAAERESGGASSAAAAGEPLSEEPETQDEKQDAPPQLPTKDEVASFAAAAAAPSEPAEAAASTASAPSIATSEGPAIAGPNLTIDPHAIELPSSAPPTPRVESPIPPTPTTADSTAAAASTAGQPPATPAKPARMTLQQRLAEAAKKRAAAAGAGAAKPEAEAERPKEEVKVEEPSGEKKSEAPDTPSAVEAAPEQPAESVEAAAEPSASTSEAEAASAEAAPASLLAEAAPLDAAADEAAPVVTEAEASEAKAADVDAAQTDAASEPEKAAEAAASAPAPEAVGLDVEVAADEASTPDAAAENKTSEVEQAEPESISVEAKEETTTT